MGGEMEVSCCAARTESARNIARLNALNVRGIFRLALYEALTDVGLC